MTSPLEEQSADTRVLERWATSSGLADAPREEREHRRLLVLGFCDHLSKTPAELVAGCLRTTKAGATAVSSPARARVNAQIIDYVAQTGLTGKDAVTAGNVIRSFLIHNGVFIQGPAWRG
jgi:hypothetical protein